MLVPVCVDEATKDWCIVEFQGQLVANEADGSAGTTDNSMKNVEIGKLSYINGQPTLRIGNHQLTGKVVKLAKPLAILERVRASGVPAIANREAEEVASSAAGDAKDSAPPQYEVKGIARTRVLFATRPKPVLS